MRCAEEFEYWIGMFFPKGTPVPDGYMYADIPSGDVGTCWILGNAECGELYGQEPYDMCMSKIIESDWKVAENPCFFERYNCPCFTAPDEKGNVILDYCTYLQNE